MKYIIQPYDDCLQYVLDNGERKCNRTGVETLSVFGYMLRVNISEHFPMVTKRKMFPKSIFAELLWMLSGSTNINDLEKLGSKIWTPWRDKEFESKNGYSDGELGPIYGFQLRNFGGDYKSNNGFDQVAYVVDQLKNNKESRRILISLWNPADMTSGKARLPCCHHLFQLNISNDGKLSGLLGQRSCDLFIGSPANIQFYSAFLYMLAQQCDLVPHELIYSMGDAHIYHNHIDYVKEYLDREAIESPKLELSKAKDVFSYKLSDFELKDYKYGARMRPSIAV